MSALFISKFQSVQDLAEERETEAVAGLSPGLMHDMMVIGKYIRWL